MQDMKRALEYYEIAADANSWVAAGRFHLWGMGMDGEERNQRKAHDYFQIGTHGGTKGYKRRFWKERNAYYYPLTSSRLRWKV